MRLGISHVTPHETPEQWAAEQRALGFPPWVFPVDYTAPDSAIAAYADACKKHDLLIAEVGAWSNPAAENAAEREAALQKCKGQLRLAEGAWARRCCVNIAGAFAGSRWDGFHRANSHPRGLRGHGRFHPRHPRCRPPDYGRPTAWRPCSG